MNSQASVPERFSPSREGPALLQGLLMCGTWGEPSCQRIPGSNLDRAVGSLLLERVIPEALALTIALQEELVQHVDEARRLRHVQVERAHDEADLAQRRYQSGP